MFASQPRLFISHRHAYGDDYWNLKHRIDAWGIESRDSSWHDHKLGDQWLPEWSIRRNLGGAISWCNVFIVVARPATANSEWCQWEVDYADRKEKPILGYSPHGMTQFPRFIREADNFVASFSYVNRLENLLGLILG